MVSVKSYLVSLWVAGVWLILLNKNLFLIKKFLCLARTLYKFVNC